MTHFRKMHGLGNDFAVFDARKSPLTLDERLASAIADRRRGIGCDTVIVIENSPSADAFMRIYNSDGSEVEACGNATRCVASLLFQESGKQDVRIDSNGGLLVCHAEGDLVSVDMGPPQLGWREIPMAQAVETVAFDLPLAGDGAEQLGKAAAVAAPNPHCVFFVTDAESAPVATVGPRVETHPWFPARTNVEFVERRSDRNLRMRVWERGVGITDACGTGACASVVAAHRRGLTGRNVDVELDGGTLNIHWREDDDHLVMTGPASLAYEGDVNLDAWRRA